MTSTQSSSALSPEDDARTLRRAPIGPGSLTWKYFGDRRIALFFGRTGTLQNMHPAVGAALQEHSNFFDDPWDRLFRSLPHIHGTIYDPRPDSTAGRVRDFHKDLKGTDSRGRRYHALNPDVYWWTHVTFVEGVIALNEFFGTPLTEAEKDQVVREGVTWWERYGLSSRPVIDNYPDWQAYWNRMLDEELESNKTTEYAMNIASVQVPPIPGIPGPVWSVVRKPVMVANIWLATGLMPERGREILGLRWSGRDQRLFDAFATVVRIGWPLLPAKLRYYDRAYVNMKRVAA